MNAYAMSLVTDGNANNLWSFLTVVATGVLGLASTYLIWWTGRQNRRLDAQDKQLGQLQNKQDDIHVLVNGNLHREQRENQRLRQILNQHGIDAND